MFLYCLLLATCSVNAQDSIQVAESTEQQLENLARTTDAATDDDAYEQQQVHYKKHPLNINTATGEQLEELNILTAMQIRQLVSYRQLLGRLINLYELQAIPAWDIATIKKLLPFITVTDDKNLAEKMKDRWTGGDRILLARYGRGLEKSRGYDLPADTGANHYLGSRDKLYLRYTYNYKNLLQWGVLAEKDAGEQFFKGYQKKGFDFYSFHFFVRKLGLIKAIAIGDFTVNFGQGLIQWQSLAFKKSADVLNIKRQSATLRPYHSAGEYNFQRGAGICLQKGKWETTLFAAVKKISANSIADSLSSDGAVSSFLTGGYHRTPDENADKSSLLQLSAGANVQYQVSRWEAGISAIYYHFSKPVEKSDKPYNLFALRGMSVTNSSFNYSYTWHNMHLFGEAAADDKLHLAFVQAALISMDAKVDAALLYRNISPAYRSVNANAFTENRLPVNENGLYAGISVRPVGAIRLDAYADLFQFPWLKYRVDAPTNGMDYLLQVTYTPNKMVALYIRYKNETKMINRSAGPAPTNIIDKIPEQNLRLHTSIIVNREISIRNRVEAEWYNRKAVAGAGQGFMTYLETHYKPNRSRWQANMCVQYFETDGFEERIYAYEADMPYSSSIPSYYGKGLRYYCNINWDASKWLEQKSRRPLKLDLWLRWAQTIYAGVTSVGTGLDETTGNRRSDIKFQVIIAR